MPPRFVPDDIRDQIRSHSDIVDVIGSYIQLKEHGRAWKACCPFHNEKTPSFTVNPERQAFHCFGCGKGGDVFKFVMEYESVDFPTAMHLLAQRAHITIPETPGRGGRTNPEESDRKDRLYDLHEKLASWYQDNLRNYPQTPVAQYLASRELDPESIAKFRLGAAPDSWDGALNFLRKTGFTQEEIRLSGVVSENEARPGSIYDRFRNRLVFPIWNEQGRVVGFSSRKVVESDGGGKYVNSPESPIFKKSRILYAFPMARREMQKHIEGAILCEGQLDVIAMHRAGFPNTIAPQGTAFTEDQAKMIRRQTDRIAIALDSDTAGTEATLRAMEILLPAGFEVKVIRFPGGKDPDELFRNQGKEAIHEAVHGAVDFMDFLIAHFGEKYDFSTPAGRSRTANEILNYLLRIDNEIRLATYVSALVRRTAIPEAAIKSELSLLRAKAQGNRLVLSMREQEAARAQPVEIVQLTPEQRRAQIAEEELLRLVLAFEPAARRAVESVDPEILSKSGVGTAIEAIIQLSINGEWFNRNNALQLVIDDYPEAGLSRFLVENAPEYEDAMREKAVEDSIATLLECHLLSKMNAAMAAWRLDPENEALREEYHDMSRQLRELRQGRKNKSRFAARPAPTSEDQQ